MEHCKAVIREGIRKGATCLFPPSDNGYCGRHQRYKLYDDGIAEGKKWCRLFFRGCNNTVVDSKTCDTCMKLKHKDIPTCSHEGCKSHVKSDKYCGKHSRDTYRDAEKELNIKYCDIARGCFTICEEGRSSCSSCLSVSRIKDIEAYNKTKTLHNLIEHVSAPRNICCRCSKEYENYLTHANNYSKICRECNTIQRNADSKRANRIRDYSKEKESNVQNHIREYCTRASRRGLTYELTPKDFTDIVHKACHYCGDPPEFVHGIDRVDNTKGYTVDNCVPACSVCNKMKYTYDIRFFLEKCKAISSGMHFTDEQFKKWNNYYTRKRCASYSSYKSSAIKRKLLFSLSNEVFNMLCSEKCYLCGYTGMVGIDRYDNTIGYVEENCKACCCSCNIMKGELTYEDMYNKTIKIATNHQKLTDETETDPVA